MAAGDGGATLCRPCAKWHGRSAKQLRNMAVSSSDSAMARKFWCNDGHAVLEKEALAGACLCQEEGSQGE